MQTKFLLYITYAYSIPICKPLEVEIKSRNMTIKWFVEKEETKKYFEDTTAILDIEEAIAYAPDIVLTATDYVADFIPGIKVQLFHGFPANKRKGTDQFIIRDFFDLYCTQGPTSTAIFLKKSKQLGHFEVQETGWPKMDALFPLTTESKNPKPVILIASTFTKKYSLALNENVLQELERLSKIGKWHFDMVLHPLHGEEIINRIKKIQNENFTYHDTFNLVPLFIKSDMMLCDTSSAMIEYLLQLKPLVTFRNNMPLPSYINVTKISEIEQAIQYALTKPSELMEKIKKYADESHPYYDGKSSKRVIDTVLAFLKKDTSYLKVKPLNLIRKYKIRKKLKYWTWTSFSKLIHLF